MIYKPRILASMMLSEANQVYLNKADNKLADATVKFLDVLC